MSPSKKILLCVSGSIAAYKAAHLASTLIQNGCEVQVVTTPSSLKFVGNATWEGLTTRPVLSDIFTEKHMMDHIHLVDWCDALIVYPATASLINRLAHGIGDGLIEALFLAYDWNKPFFLAPSMNERMLDNPITQTSLVKLESMGVEIIDPEEGFLACGKEGKGRLASPEIAWNTLENVLEKKEAVQKLNVLITGGGTREPIDSIRSISNHSSGTTSLHLANFFKKRGHKVSLIGARYQKTPQRDVDFYPYTTFEELQETMQHLIKDNNYDVVIHAAAVSDYKIDSFVVDGHVVTQNLQSKVSSSQPLEIHLSPRIKLLNLIKNQWGFEGKLISFKLTAYADDKKIEQAVLKQKNESLSDYVIHNDMSFISPQEHVFTVYSEEKNSYQVHSATALASYLEHLLTEEVMV